MGRHNNRFRSKRKGRSKSYNANGQGVTTTQNSFTIYSMSEVRETLMGITGNLAVRPSTATGAAFFSIQLDRDLPGVVGTDPQNDSEGYEQYTRLWDYVVSFDAGATETRIIPIVSKKRRKLYVGDVIHMVYISNVANVAIFSI